MFPDTASVIDCRVLTLVIPQGHLGIFGGVHVPRGSSKCYYCRPYSLLQPLTSPTSTLSTLRVP